MCPDSQPTSIATILPQSTDSPQKLSYPVESIQEAQLLLGYVARNGLNVDETIITDIVQAKSWAEQGNWDAEKEIRFWNAFNTLARTIQPVSIASLRADATSTVSFYQKWSVLVLIILLLVQVYLLTGSSRYESFAELPPKVEALMTQLDMAIETTPPEQRAESRKINTLIAEIDEYNTLMAANYKLLEDWSLRSLWQFIFPFKWFEETSSESEGVQQETKQAKILLVEKELILQIVQFYILPLLYGLLGASAYVLRTLNTEVRNLTYVTTSNISYRLRIQLGALSGLAIGWFAGFDSSLSFGSLSPLALAFVAGYSVEVLFTAMDRLIAAFSNFEKNTFSEKQAQQSVSQPKDTSLSSQNTHLIQ